MPNLSLGNNLAPASDCAMRCTVFEKLWADYLDTLEQWESEMRKPLLTLSDLGRSGQASAKRDAAMERAYAHQRKCLLCTNIKPLVRHALLRTSPSSFAE